MIAKDSLGFRSEDGGFVTKKEYLGYLHGQVGEEEFTSVGIVVTRAHVYHGKRDDPCLCPLALALKDMFDTSDDISVGDERGDLSILNSSTNYFICPLRPVRRIPRRVSVFLINRPRSLPVRRRAVAVDLL